MNYIWLYIWGLLVGALITLFASSLILSLGIAVLGGLLAGVIDLFFIDKHYKKLKNEKSI